MPRKRVNKKVIVSLTMFALAMIIGASWLILRQLQHRDPQYFVELARQSEMEGDWRSAVMLYKRAYDESEDEQYLVSAGDLYLEAGEIVPALNFWQIALINQPDLIAAHQRMLDLRLDIATLYDRTADWKAVRETADAFLSRDIERTSRDEAHAKNALGLALVRLADLGEGNAELGEKALRAAADLAPEVVEYQLDLADHLVRSDRAESGRTLYEELLSRYAGPGADAAKVRVAYARFLASHDTPENARKLFAEAAKLAGNDPEAVQTARKAQALFLAQRWSAARRGGDPDAEQQELLDETERLLKACVEADPDDYEPYMQLAVLYGLGDRPEQVVDVCETRLQRGLSRKGVRAPRNRLNAFTLMIYASEACISLASRAHEKQDEPTRQQFLSRAERFLKDARAELPSNPRALMEAGRLKLARGLDRQALDDFRAAQQGYRAAGVTNWDNVMTLAGLHLKLNEAGAARAELEQVVDEARRVRGGDPAFWTLYAQVLVQTKEFDRALSIADRILQIEPGRSDAIKLKVAILERQGRTEEASRLAESLTTDKVTRALIQARRNALSDNKEGAIAVLESALQQSPADPRLVGAMVRALVYLDRLDESRAVVDRALAVNPNDKQLQTWSVLTRADLTPDQRDAALLDIIEKETDDYQRSIEEVDFYLRRKDYEKSLAALDAAFEELVAAKTPVAQRASIGQHRLLLETKVRVANTLGNDKAVEEARGAAIEYDVDGAGGKSIVGLCHLYRNEYEAAIRAFREALELQPTDSRVMAFLGQSFQLSDRPEEARSFYERAVSANPDEGLAYKGMAMLAKMRGDSTEYERLLEESRRLIPNDPWVEAELLERAEKADPKAAIARREAAREKDPDDRDNAERLCALYVGVGDRTSADACYERILARWSQERGLVAGVAAYYRDTGRADRAVAVAQRFAESAQGPAEQAAAQLLLASQFLATGDNGKAERALLKAASLDESPRTVESVAEFYVRVVGRPTDGLPWWDKAVALARRENSPRLPHVLASRIRCLLHRNLNDVEQAGEYVDRLLADVPDYPPGLLLLSQVHARLGDIEGSIEALTDYLRVSPDAPAVLFQRALDYLARGRAAPAIQDLERIKRVSPLALDLQPRLLLVRLRKQTGRVDLLLRETEALVEDAPDDPRAVGALVDTYIEGERLTEAERLLTARLNSAEKEPKPDWFTLRADVARRMGDTAQAVDDIKRADELRGHDAPGMTAALGMFRRVGRATEGIEYFERFVDAASAPPETLAAYAQLLFDDGRTTKGAEAFRRAMAKAVASSLQSVRVVSAFLRETFSDAEAVQRAVGAFEADAPTGAAGRVNDRILARLYRFVDEFDKAERVLERLISTCQESGERGQLLHEEGDMYQAWSKPRKARKAYEEALQYNNNDWITLNNLSYVLSESLGENERAKAYAARAVAKIDNPDTRDTLGWIYVNLGDFNKAIAELSAAIRQGSTNPAHYLHLGEAYRRAGAASTAKNLFRIGRSYAEQAGDVEMLDRIDDSIKRATQPDDTP